MTHEDQIQHGRVVHVGLSTVRQADSIKKTSNLDGSIDVAPGGVIGDYHFLHELDYDRSKLLHLHQFPELKGLVQRQGGRVINTHQISLFESEQIEFLSRASHQALSPGCFGENITTQGIKLNEIRYNSIIVINNLKFRVKARRSFCRRFFSDCPLELAPRVRYDTLKNVTDTGEMRVGIICQVLGVGRISEGDHITVYPDSKQLGLPWTKLPVSISGPGKPSQDRAEYLPE